MANKGRFAHSVSGLAAVSAMVGLLTCLPAASADELADLRANQELLQKRIDQLSQAPAQPQAAPYVPGFGPETHKQVSGIPVVGGSFPRSFLIPGTDTSLRIGGFANASALWFIRGVASGGQLDGHGSQQFIFTEGQGGTGNLSSMPLNNDISRGRDTAFIISGRQTRFLVDARTPTAWGQARAYLEIDFSYNNTNSVENNAQAVASSWLPRFRKGYATLGALEAGQDTGILHDPDADAELVDFGGSASGAGRARQPQVKYTYAGPYGTVFTGGVENPVPQLNGPFGQVSIDTNQIPNIAACSVTGNFTANLPATTACLGSNAFFSPLKQGWPEAIATARINQPWGHLQVGAVVRTDQLNDGQYLDQTYLGFGGTLSGDVHPFSGNPGPLGKDDLGFGVCAGIEVGNQCANGTAVVTDFGAPLNVPGFGLVNPLTSAQWNTTNSATRQAYDRVVSSQSSSSYGAWIWYQHWWTDNLRSTIATSGIWNAVNTNILCVNMATCNLPATSNKGLAVSYANLFWSPVAFIDFGGEYGWGHRMTVNNFKGDAYAIEGLMRVRF